MSGTVQVRAEEEVEGSNSSIGERQARSEV
jgi:hypothetical protein